VTTALTLRTYPRDPVNVACRKCGRIGCYLRQSLIARFGDDATMPDVLMKIADCQHRGNATNPCGVIYPNLARRPRPARLVDGE
jgi:hypothetical protein